MKRVTLVQRIYIIIQRREIFPAAFLEMPLNLCDIFLCKFVLYIEPVQKGGCP